MTSSVACPDRRDLQRMALGQLSAPEAERLGHHVLNCSACAELFNSFQADDPLLFDLMAGACWETVVAGRPAAEVAAELGITANAVYVAKARVLNRLRQDLDGFLD